MVKPTLPVDIYLRVSRVGSREHLISPDEQERRARALARDRDLTVGRVIVDLDESGGKLERPGLQEVLQRVEARESGGVIVAWLDRLSRDSEHAHGLLRRIDDAGGHVYAPDAPEDMTTPEGELMVGIMFAFATYVRKRARAGLERAKENAIADGRPVITRPAVGYRLDEDRRLELDPKTAPVVREVFERRAAGAGPAALGDLLQERGVPTSQGSAVWSRPAIYGLLSNRVYLGEIRYGRDDRYVNGAAHKPIVDLALWTAAQHPNGRALTRTSQRSAWLLAGILRCHACRYCLQGTTTSRGKRIYRCTRTHAAGVCPAPVRLRAEPVEAAAVEAFWSLTADLEAHGSADTRPDHDALETALERAETALRQYMSPDVQEAIADPALWAAGLRQRREARDTAAGDLGRARAAAAPATASPSVETLSAAWGRMTTQDRRELLALRFDAIAVRRDPSRLVFYPSGTAPADLPRRGYRKAPTLRPFPDAPEGAPVVALA